MKEAGELMGKMKGMKGMGAMNDMFKNLAKGMGGGASGINVGALQRMQKQMAAKERMRAKMDAKSEANANAKKHIEKTNDPARAVFRIGEEDAAPEYSTTNQKVALADEELVAMFADKPPSQKSKPTDKPPSYQKKKKTNKK